jgi:hypothetical protein
MAMNLYYQASHVHCYLYEGFQRQVHSPTLLFGINSLNTDANGDNIWRIRISHTPYVGFALNPSFTFLGTHVGDFSSWNRSIGEELNIMSEERRVASQCGY